MAPSGPNSGYSALPQFSNSSSPAPSSSSSSASISASNEKDMRTSANEMLDSIRTTVGKFVGDGRQRPGLSSNIIKRLAVVFSIAFFGLYSIHQFLRDPAGSTPWSRTERAKSYSDLSALDAPVVYPTWHDVPPSHLYPLPLSATLEDRLKAWRNAPGKGWEPADFVAWNLQTCGDAVPNHNKDLIAKASLIWAVMNSTAILTHRERMAVHLEEQRDAGAWSDPVHVSKGGHGYIGTGRGIVFTAGNSDTLQRVAWTLKLIRKYYKCTLPASIYHFPSEAPDPNSPLVQDLISLGANLVSATSRTKDSTRTKNYHLKAQAILESPYAEVLYLDSDNLPTLDVELLFEQDGYKTLGVMFWPDYWKTSANNPIWAIAGVQCRDEWEQEAGQIIIDKRLHLDALILSAYMLADWQFWYNFSDGDKDVFRFTFLMLRKRWALPGKWVGAGGLPAGTASGEFCAHTMMQYDEQGDAAFVHYNLLKQIPSGVGRGFSWGRTKQMREYERRWWMENDTEISSWNGVLPAITPEQFEADRPDKGGLKATDKWWLPDSHTSIRKQWHERYAYPDANYDTFTGKKGKEVWVHADQLANCRDDGMAIAPANDPTRRRCATERGIRPYWHGGVISALCIDLRWEDPMSPKTREANTVTLPNGTKTAPNELGIDWGVSPLEVVWWADDDRLALIERHVYDEGFVPNGKGF